MLHRERRDAAPDEARRVASGDAAVRAHDSVGVKTIYVANPAKCLGFTPDSVILDCFGVFEDQ